MVAEIIKGHKRYYVCDECGMGYAKLELAKKCQAWCTKHRSCNLEIIKFAINAKNPCVFCCAKVKRRLGLKNNNKDG
ncbi:MAG: hypothetical protein NT099_06115 [Candidatus Saganbacteria bacterium]|nr:hypothetical protein [Candidatus Saganbacteria bacterium]